MECINFFFFSFTRHPDISTPGISQIQNLNSDSHTRNKKRQPGESRQCLKRTFLEYQPSFWIRASTASQNFCLLFLRANIYRNNRRICWERHQLFPAWCCRSSGNFLGAFLVCTSSWRQSVHTAKSLVEDCRENSSSQGSSAEPPVSREMALFVCAQGRILCWTKDVN